MPELVRPSIARSKVVARERVRENANIHNHGEYIYIYRAFVTRSTQAPNLALFCLSQLATRLDKPTNAYNRNNKIFGRIQNTVYYYYRDGDDKKNIYKRVRERSLSRVSILRRDETPSEYNFLREQEERRSSRPCKKSVYICRKRRRGREEEEERRWREKRETRATHTRKRLDENVRDLS